MQRLSSRSREKLKAAEYKLAVGEGDVRARLRYVFKLLRTLRPHDLPAELRDDFNWVMTQLTRYGPDKDEDGTVYRTAIDHTMSRIRNSTGRKIAEVVVRLSRSTSSP